jgi:hypothetical protein
MSRKGMEAARLVIEVCSQSTVISLCAPLMPAGNDACGTGRTREVVVA